MSGEPASAESEALANDPNDCDATGRFDSSDPRSICTAVCKSAEADSDVVVHIKQTAEASGSFVAKVTQTRPERVHMTFHHVKASWSGDFMNFDDETSHLPLKFHELVAAGSAPSDANVEIYTNDNTLGGGPVNVSKLDCVVKAN